MSRSYVVVTGMSGAGRSTASAMLEDMGWFVIDNLPGAVITTVARQLDDENSDIDRVAFVIGRGGGEDTNVLAALEDLEAAGDEVRVLFLDAPDDVLVRRYEGSRRRHPVVARGVTEAIVDERKQLEPLRDRADVQIDTGDLNTNQLRQRVQELFGDDGRAHMVTSIMSFGYKHGLPPDVDLVFDARFLPNPFWIDNLRDLSGLDCPVADYVRSQAMYSTFVERMVDLLTELLPLYEKEGKSYLTVAVGCTGGRHRSVVLAEELATRLARDDRPISAFHRDVDR